MADYQLSDSAKLMFVDRLYPSTGTIGYLAILDNNLLDNAIFSANASADTLTFDAANKLVTGSRIRLTSTTTLPGGLLSNTDYFTIEISTTEFKLASTLANAIDGTAVNITDAGSGTLKAFEQELSPSDSLAALVAHEIVNSAYTERLSVENLGAAVIANGDAQKNPWIKIFTNSSISDLITSARVLIYGGSQTIGDTSGTGYSLHQEVNTIYAGQAQSFSIVFMR
jgi:hypothetical protein